VAPLDQDSGAEEDSIIEVKERKSKRNQESGRQSKHGRGREKESNGVVSVRTTEMQHQPSVNRRQGRNPSLMFICQDSGKTRFHQVGGRRHSERGKKIVLLPALGERGKETVEVPVERSWDLPIGAIEGEGEATANTFAV